MITERFEKVVVFATRKNGRDIELISFLHPLAGRQLPAGSVEQNESPVHAAIRELFEETGEDHPLFYRELSFRDVTFENGGQLKSTVPCHGQDSETISRGSYVRILLDRDSTLDIVSEEFNYDVDPPVIIDQKFATIQRTDIATTLRRYFFHIELPTRDMKAWPHAADGHVFHVERNRIEDHPNLIGQQQEWLNDHLHFLKG